MQITWNDFNAIELCAGTITKVELFPEAKKSAYKLWADFGVHGIKKSSAQITALYSPEELIGKQIIGVLNFPVKQIGPFQSEFLTTGFVSAGGVILAVPDKETPNGAKLS